MIPTPKTGAMSVLLGMWLGSGGARSEGRPAHFLHLSSPRGRTVAGFHMLTWLHGREMENMVGRWRDMGWEVGEHGREVENMAYLGIDEVGTECRLRCDYTYGV